MLLVENLEQPLALTSKKSNIESFERFVIQHRESLSGNQESIEKVCNDYIKNNIKHYQLLYYRKGHKIATETMYEDFNYLIDFCYKLIK